MLPCILILYCNGSLVCLDSFTVSLHSRNDRRLPAVGLCNGQGKGAVIGLWKTVDIPTGHMSPQSIANKAIPYYI